MFKKSLLHSAALAFAVVISTVGVAVADPYVLVRVPTGASMPAELTKLFAKWRHSGQVADITLLAQGQTINPKEKAQFEAFALLDFSSEKSYKNWEKTAKSSLPKGLEVHRADRTFHGETTPRDSEHSFFAVNSYTPIVAHAKYDEMAQGYLKPLYVSMSEAKLLVSYAMYWERGAVSKANAYIILEYRDLDTFTTMGPAKTAIREKLLKSSPSYAKIDPIKDTLRIDNPSTRTTRIVIPQ